MLAFVGLGYVAWLRGEAVTPPADPSGEGDETQGDEPNVPGGGEPSGALPDAPPEPGAAEQPAAGDNPSKKLAPSGKRWVVFKPTPSNVSISVDGSPFKPYGPDFRRVRLKVGNHTFRFVGAEGCCEERVVRRRVSPGTRDFELPVKLRYKPASLYLKVPAIKGRTEVAQIQQQGKLAIEQLLVSRIC